MTKTIEDLFYYCSIASDILFLLLIFLFYKLSRFSLDVKIIAIYTIISIISGLSVEYYLPNSLQFSITTLFTFFEQLAFSAFLYLNIKSNSWKKALVVSTIAFFLFIVIYIILLQTGAIPSPKAIDSIPIGIETILVLVFTFYYFYEQMNDITNSYIYSRYHFWFVLGFTIYLSGSFFIYIFASQVDRTTLLQYWFITNIFYIIKNILFIVGIKAFVKGKEKFSRPNHTYSPYLN